jgi:hypothetical protein
MEQLTFIKKNKNFNYMEQFTFTKKKSRTENNFSCTEDALM